MKVKEYANSQAATTRDTSNASRVRGNKETSEKERSSRSDSEEASATASISGRAREMAKAKDAASAAPDTREARIAELKRRIAAKEYNVSADDVADKMVEEHLKTRDLG